MMIEFGSKNLGALMLRVCVRYLLLREIATRSLVSDGQLVTEQLP
jgi:hypothetical protein